MIKTINLNGSEIRVAELGGDNTEIFNNSNGTIYASKLPNIIAGGDDVIAIPTGAIDGLYGTHGTVYLLGSGSVEVRGVDHKITVSRGISVIGEGGSGISQSYVDEKCGETLNSANAYTDSLNAELAGFVGYTDNDIYGLEADFENCVFTRMAGAIGKNPGTDFDSVRAYGGRRRCNLSDDGKVLAYYGDENFKVDGSNGQVMVEQPKFYYRVVPLKTEKIDGADGYHLRKARYYISDTPKAGFKVHPAFVSNGVEVDKIYLSAFEGCIYDTSAETYILEDEQVADFDNDKLSSIAGVKPCSGEVQVLTATNTRKLANNRGERWGQCTVRTLSITQFLFLIEYAAFNSQEKIGMGIVNKSSSEATGATLSLGNSSGAIEIDKSNSYISYRGEENLWGNIQTWVDDLNENESTDYKNNFWFVHISSRDNCDSESHEKGIYTTYGYGYISSFSYSEKYDWVFLPSEIKGNSVLPVGDRTWNSGHGERACNIRGRWDSNTVSGLFSTDFSYAAASSIFDTGARLTYT